MAQTWHQARGIAALAALAGGPGCADRTPPRGEGGADLTITALDGDEGGAAMTAAPAELPDRAPDRVRVYIEAEPLHLNPNLDPDVWGRRIAFDAVLEPLLRRTPDGHFEPQLAERVTVEEGGRRVIIALRDGVRWHDGRGFSSVDVTFTLDRLRSPKTRAPRAAALLAEVERVELAGRLGVRLELRRPQPRLLDALAEIAILPAHVFERGDLDRHPANRRPIGTGPFRLDEWQHRRLTLSRVDRYWGPAPRAAAIDVFVEPDAAKTLFLARRGDVDVLGHLPPSYVPEQIETPAVRARLETVRTPSHRFAFVQWNRTRAPLDDPSVRRALSMAIDRRRILDEARHGLGRPIETVPADAAPAPGRGDVARANAVLDAAGLPRGGTGGGGTRTRGGRAVRLAVLVPAGAREAEAAARLLADAIGRVGLAVELVSLELPALLARVARGAYDGALLEWSGITDDDLEPVLGSGAQGVMGPGGASSRTIDAGLAALRLLPEGEARRRAREQLAVAVSDLAPALFLYAADEVYLHARRLGAAVPEGQFFRLRDLGPR